MCSHYTSVFKQVQSTPGTRTRPFLWQKEIILFAELILSDLVKDRGFEPLPRLLHRLGDLIVL